MLKFRILFFASFLGLSLLGVHKMNRFFLPPSYIEFKSQFISSERLLLDRKGKVLHELRFNHKVRRFEWIPLSEVAASLKKSVIAAEDKRFYSHFGVDWLSFSSALYHRIMGTPRGGASTISMQLTEFFNSLNGKIKNKRNGWDKIAQMIRASYLESQWNKDQILEAYLNLIHFKGELQGVSASSYGLFEKDPISLNLNESIIMTVLIRSPNSTPQKIIDRAVRLSEVLEAKALYSDLASLASQVSSAQYKIKPIAQNAFHIAHQVQHLGLFKNQVQVKTTLDSDIQRLATAALRKQVLSLKDQNMNDGAVVVLDNETGDILAYVGNVGAQSSAPHVDGARSLRQAGSTLKPFLYGSAFEKKLLTPASVLNDSPLDIFIQGSGSYRPQNYDRNFHSFVTVRNALASSLNIPAVKTIEMVGVPSFTETLSSLGITDLERPDFYGPSLALGSADVRLVQLTNAYRTLANKGIWSPTQFVKPTTLLPGHRVFTDETAYLVSSILSDREARSTTFGLENMLSTRYWTAVKTGTSKDMRDNWCVGYSKKYTVGVWTGNFSGESMWSVTGIQGAAPVWLEVMNSLHETVPSAPPALPAKVISKTIHFPQWKVTKNEVFLKGTEPTSADIRFESQPSAKIIYPLNGSYMALDPEIPSKNQKVFINIDNPSQNIKILMNNKEIGTAEKYFLWKPKVGKHTLKLIDPDKNTIDEIQFEIKGLKIKS